MKKLTMLLGLACVLAAVPAHAGTKFFQLDGGKLLTVPFYADKGEDLNFTVGAKDAVIICGLEDKEKDVLASDGDRDGCMLFLTAPYTGKYYLLIKNKGSAPVRGFISSTKEL